MARSLESGLSVIIDLPYWQDCLKFSAGGQLAEMRRVVPLSESDLVAQTPHFASRRQAMRTLFDLSPISDSVRELHSAVVEISPLYAACGTDGWQFESLFGRFNVMQNGEWRRRLSLEA
jgi:hypothetical protein